MALKKANDLGNTTGFKFEKKGDKLVGYYIKTTEEIINGSNCKKHFFGTKSGIVTVLGQANMYKQLVDNNCQSCMVEVSFTGNALKLKGGKTMKVYEVYFDETDRWDGGEIETAGVDQDEVDGYDEPSDDTALDEEEAPLDESPPARTTAPKHAAAPADPAGRAAVQNLLKNNGARRA